MTTKPKALTSRDLEALLRAAPTGSPEYHRLSRAWLRRRTAERQAAHLERQRRAALRPPPSAETLRVVALERAHWAAHEAGNRAAEDDETTFQRAWDRQWDRERADAAEPGSISAHEISHLETE